MRENKESEFMFYDDIKVHELDQRSGWQEI